MNAENRPNDMVAILWDSGHVSIARHDERGGYRICPMQVAAPLQPSEAGEPEELRAARQLAIAGDRR